MFFRSMVRHLQGFFSRSIMCIRFYINTAIRGAFPGPPMWSRHPPLAVWSLGLPLHGDRDRAVVELDPCDFDRIHDPARHVDEDWRSHADLERPRSDNASFLKSRVTHRVSLAPGRGRRGRLSIGRGGRRGPESGTRTSTLLSIPSEAVGILAGR